MANELATAFLRDQAWRNRLEGKSGALSDYLANELDSAARNAEQSETARREQWIREEEREREQARHDEEIEAQEDIAEELANLVEILDAPRRAAEAEARKKTALSQLKADAMPVLEHAIAEAEEADDLKESSAVIIWLSAKQLRSACDVLEVDELPLNMKVNDLVSRAELIAQRRLGVCSIETHVALAIELVEALHAFWHSGLWEWTLWNRSFPCLTVSGVEQSISSRVCELETLGCFAMRALKAVTDARGSGILADPIGGKLGVAEWLEVVLREPSEMPGWGAPSFQIDSFLEALQHFSDRSRAALFLENVVERSRVQMMDIFAEAENQSILLGLMRWIPMPFVLEWVFRSRRPQFEIGDFELPFGIPVVWGVAGLITSFFTLGDITLRSLSIAFGSSALLAYFIMRYARAKRRLRGSVVPIGRLICKGVQNIAVDRLLANRNGGEIAEKSEA